MTPPHRWSFSLRRLFLVVTAVAIVAGLARVSPGSVAVALFFGLLSSVCIGLCWLMVRFERREYSAVAFGCLPVAAVLAAMFAVVSMMLFVLSAVIAFTASISR
jgi:uncharacterized membrane protein YhdT